MIMRSSSNSLVQSASRLYVKRGLLLYHQASQAQNSAVDVSFQRLVIRKKSSFVDAFSSAGIKAAVKSTLLKEAASEDSPLWISSASRSKKQHLNRHLVNGMLSNTSIIHQRYPEGGVNDGMLQDDPLDDLYIPNASARYWPELPPSILDANGLLQNADPFVLTKTELSHLSDSIREDLIGTDHPVLNKAASYFFEATVDGGKKVRPMMVLLLSRALSDTMGAQVDSSSSSSQFFASPLPWQRSDLPAAQRRLAEISEMIHTASLFHDDVIDGADTRRGAPSVHMVFGNKMAILAGDYLLARASISLARLRNVQVVEAMSTIIEHLVRGEVMQMKGSESTNDAARERMVYYLRKNYYKTGSLMANSCRSAALLGDYPPELVSASYRFGKHVGMAFQLVDDVLDFEGSLASLGKPALSDLKAGLATAPVLLAAQEQPALWTLVDRKFSEPGDVDQAVHCVAQSTALEQTKQLARVHAERAMDAILIDAPFRPSQYRDALVVLANKVVARTK